MRDNRHKRANIAFGASMLGPQLYLLGAPIGAFQVAVAGTRALVMNIIDDESYKTRVAVSGAFWMSAVGISTSAGLIQKPMDLLPLAAMTCGTIADACPDKMTHITRLSKIFGGSLWIPYHSIVSGSVAAVANEAIAVTNLFRTAVINDVPVKDDENNRITTLHGQFKGWWNSVLTMERIPQDRAGRPDPLTQSIQNLRTLAF